MFDNDYEIKLKPIIINDLIVSYPTYVIDNSINNYQLLEITHKNGKNEIFIRYKKNDVEYEYDVNNNISYKMQLIRINKPNDKLFILHCINADVIRIKNKMTHDIYELEYKELKDNFFNIITCTYKLINDNNEEIGVRYESRLKDKIITSWILKDKSELLNIAKQANKEVKETINYYKNINKNNVPTILSTACTAQIISYIFDVELLEFISDVVLDNMDIFNKRIPKGYYHHYIEEMSK